MKQIEIKTSFTAFQSVDELPQDVRSLMEKAVEIRKNAYAPYSKFRVGAALLLDNGKIVLGSNISGINDILKPFPNYMFKADDINSLEHKIIGIKYMSANDSELLGKAMRDRVVDVFSIEYFLDNHQNLYIELVN